MGASLDDDKWELLEGEYYKEAEQNFDKKNMTVEDVRHRDITIW